MSAHEQFPVVLAVDDYADWRWVIKDVLKKNKIRLLFAGSVDEAKLLLQQENVDLVISGLKMIDGSGLDIFRLIEGQKTPFILCTAYPREMTPNIEHENFTYVWKGEVRILASEVSRLLEGSS